MRMRKRGAPNYGALSCLPLAGMLPSEPCVRPRDDQQRPRKLFNGSEERRRRDPLRDQTKAHLLAESTLSPRSTMLSVGMDMTTAVPNRPLASCDCGNCACGVGFTRDREPIRADQGQACPAPMARNLLEFVRKRTFAHHLQRLGARRLCGWGDKGAPA